MFTGESRETAGESFFVGLNTGVSTCTTLKHVWCCLGHFCRICYFTEDPKNDFALSGAYSAGPSEDTKKILKNVFFLFSIVSNCADAGKGYTEVR